MLYVESSHLSAAIANVTQLVLVGRRADGLAASAPHGHATILAVAA